MRTTLRCVAPLGLLAAVMAAVGCSSSHDGTTSAAGYTPTEAVGADAVVACTTSSFTSAYPGATYLVSTVVSVAAGANEAAGSSGQTIAMPEYCKVTGTLNPRVSTVDGKSYGIGFELRLPTHWNGRFFHQVNGGTDGAIVAAVGDILGGGQGSCGLSKGFAVISTNAGHATEAGAIGGGLFGMDPQARVDYGYAAVQQVTPFAKAMIKAYYGKGPDKSYIAGTSNGGRHAMVAASRLGDQYDGFLVGSPGFNLPKAAVAQLWGVQQYDPISTGTTTGNRPDISTSFTVPDVVYIGSVITAKCDALDGVVDAMVQNVVSCQAAFDPSSDLSTCTTPHTGACLTSGQKTVLMNVHAGARNSAGAPLYANFLWDPGISNTSSSGFRTWKFSNSTGPRDPLSVAFIFMVPPVSPTVLTGTGTTLLDFALNHPAAAVGFDVDRDAEKIFATSATYAESAMSFMTPPDLTMAKMVANHGRMLLVQGSADPVFTVQDTIDWLDGFKAHWGVDAASAMARLFIVPGMGHSRGGPATDQYDMVEALVNWVERGIAPDSVIARARGAGSGLAGASLNPDVPAAWSGVRTRPLCAYPKIARYDGTGDIEVAASFSCQ